MSRPAADQPRNPWSSQLVALRKARGFSTASAAALHLGINADNYRAVEAGRNISVALLQRILRGFHSSLAELESYTPVPVRRLRPRRQRPR